VRAKFFLPQDATGFVVNDNNDNNAHNNVGHGGFRHDWRRCERC
jgi:hypothetical protein